MILATGGLGALYAVTTNPLEARGEGLGMAARAGAMIADPEFVQFHPTAIAVGRDPAPLATEALRGEGATLIDESGRALHERQSTTTPKWGRATSWPAPFIARSLVVRRFIWIAAAPSARNFRDHFPTVFAACQSAGIDPAHAA